MPPVHEDTPVRRLLLALVLFGTVGLLAELVFLEHWERTPQWTPLVALTLVLGAAGVLWIRPSGRAVRLFRGVMALVTVVGLVGVAFHLNSNVAFEREIDPDASGFGFLRAVLQGATPTLAPGALVQLGLLGLILTFRHPLLRDGGEPSRSLDSSTEAS